MALWLPNYQAPIVRVRANMGRVASCKTPQLLEIRLVETLFFFQQLVNHTWVGLTFRLLHDLTD